MVSLVASEDARVSTVARRCCHCKVCSRRTTLRALCPSCLSELRSGACEAGLLLSCLCEWWKALIIATRGKPKFLIFGAACFADACRVVRQLPQKSLSQRKIAKNWCRRRSTILTKKLDSHKSRGVAVFASNNLLCCIASPPSPPYWFEITT